MKLIQIVVKTLAIFLLIIISFTGAILLAEYEYIKILVTFGAFGIAISLFTIFNLLRN
ncbi:hypothetical protein [Campylobacter peloridis]|uniref:hypothetical protein n=1 Tax=Campylobacter peloridis TaxID=488546 RepID=UPI00164F0574|nr:hypothetical protein [Campylobacter peloridis]